MGALLEAPPLRRLHVDVLVVPVVLNLVGVAAEADHQHVHVIEATPEGAKGTVDMLMIGLGGDPNKIEYDGYYEDTYVRTPQGWRFKQRVHHALLREGQRVTPAPKPAQ